MKKTLGVLLYDKVQPMDFIGFWEVFATWKTNLNPSLDMFLISRSGKEVACMNGITVKTHCGFEDSPNLDYLFIPGGIGRIKEVDNEQLIAFIKKQAKQAEYI